MNNSYNDELYHYGVLGMKWGVKRALAKERSILRLKKKADRMDIKSAKAYKKAEKRHAEYDLESKNTAAKKAAKFKKKAAKLDKRALKTEDEWQKTKLENRSAKYNYKAAKQLRKANLISRTTGYGIEAMTYATKSDKYAQKAAKARYKAQKNAKYIAATKRKISSVESDPKLSKTVAEIKSKYKDFFG